MSDADNLLTTQQQSDSAVEEAIWLLPDARGHPSVLVIDDLMTHGVLDGRKEESRPTDRRDTETFLRAEGSYAEGMMNRAKDLAFAELDEVIVIPPNIAASSFALPSLPPLSP